MKKTIVSLSALSALFLPTYSNRAADPQNLQDAVKEINNLKARLDQLEKLVAGMSQTNAPATTPKSGIAASTTTTTTTTTSGSALTAPAQSATEADITKMGFVKWNELMIGRSRFKLYGFLRLDAVHDDSRPNNTQVPAFIRSEDPTAPAAIGSPRNSEDFTLHPRLTRFGIDFDGPELSMLGAPKPTGKVEIDFYNLVPGVAESREALRIRHAYLKLSWQDVSLLAGQTVDVIAPLTPIVNPDFVMWGAGNLGDRRPQLRLEYMPALGPGKLILQTAAGLTGADDNLDVDGVGFRDGEASGRPTVQGRIAYALPLWEKQNIEFGVWGHRSWEKADAPVGASGHTDFDSEAAGLDLMVPIYKDKVWLKGEAWAGKNLADIRGGILQGINATTGMEVHADGGWLELGVRPIKWSSFYAGYSTDNPRDSDLSKGGRTLNSIYYLAWRGYFDPVEVGLDYLNWTTHYNGFGSGTDNRYQGFISYKF